ncbi:transposase [Deinococcus sp. Leaf326]|uniref:RNA-guided endonuclease InsQ/TnpB family protein n=1 Tax=Deinococcus sp. Leaf326 TaxID=1736338 RepID=UPI001F363256|nr:transposase [Deinococcus sp. Leaf326]
MSARGRELQAVAWTVHVLPQEDLAPRFLKAPGPVKRKRTSAFRPAQRAVSRKRNKRSNRRRKAVQQVAKLHRTVARQRLDFHHKTALKLVRENDLIAHEDLNVGGMGRGNLARSIHDVGWSQFFSLLSQKAEWSARKVVRVDPRHTSQRCNACEHTCREIRASQSRFRCVACAHVDNANLNAARNILGRAAPSGSNVAVVNASVA